MLPEKINVHHVMAPTEIVTFDIPLDQNYQRQCIDEAYKIGDSMSRATNVKASMSTFHVHQQTSVYNQILKDITDSIKYAPWTDVSCHVYTLYDAWVSIYKDGDYTIPHNHMPAFVSFCYYLKADETSAPLVFDETNFSIRPRTGLCVLFEGNVLHSVPKQEGAEDRLILAGNYYLQSGRE